MFDPIGEGEPVVASHLATAQSGGGADVPAGMRAVSVHVTDSTGVLALLRAGQKVDVQVVVHREGLNTGAEVRTALEELTVLSVQPQTEQSSQGANLPVVTLLAKPAEADVLAAADSGARVRLTLRNPLDDVHPHARSPDRGRGDAYQRTAGSSGETPGHEIAQKAAGASAAVSAPAAVPGGPAGSASKPSASNRSSVC